MDANEFVAEYLNDVIYAARKASYQSPGIEAEDIEQDVWEALLKRPAVWEQNRQVVITAIDREAKKYAEKETVDYMYFSGAFIYNPQMIRALMGEVVWCPSEECMDVEARVDLRNAFTELARRKPAQARAVFKHYGQMDYDLMSATEKSNDRHGIEFIANHLNKRAPIKAEDLEEVVNAGIA